MARMTTTNQKKNTTIPGIAYPATVLALATASSYPAPPDLSANCGGGVGFIRELMRAVGPAANGMIASSRRRLAPAGQRFRRAPISAF